MGNRAVITADKSVSTGIGVYLHWNGGRDSVEAFLAYCKLKGYRTPDKDNYGWARLCQVIGNYFGGENSVGIDKCEQLDCDNFDNGVYIIENWEIVGRKYQPHYEQHEYDMCEMLNEINEAQPEKERLEQKVIDEYCNKTPELASGNEIVEGKIFEDVKSLKDLKLRYKALAQIHHPDKGGNEDNMKKINKEYKERIKHFESKER